VIKLMKDKVQWQREMVSRSWEWDPATNTYVPSRNQEALDAQYVVQALEAPTQAEMAAAVSESPLLQQLAEKYMEKASIKEYAYPVVMDAANRNLAQIYLQERPGPDSLRDLARQIFEAVQHLHSRKLMHGDLKVRAHRPCYCNLSATTTTHQQRGGGANQTKY
jgi:serine/threonine protein kinase